MASPTSGGVRSTQRTSSVQKVPSPPSRYFALMSKCISRKATSAVGAELSATPVLPEEGAGVLNASIHDAEAPDATSAVWERGAGTGIDSRTLALGAAVQRIVRTPHAAANRTATAETRVFLSMYFMLQGYVGFVPNAPVRILAKRILKSSSEVASSGMRENPST